MLKKPQPKETVIDVSVYNPRLLDIVVTTDDAKDSLQKIASEFGALVRDNLEKNRYSFVISKAYDPAEVTAYLREIL